MPDPVINTALLDEKLAALEGARSWSPRLISRLESLIYADDDYDLFRVNPLAFARARGIDQGEAIDLFLHAAKLGLFEMQWNMVCAGCGGVFRSFEHMAHLHSKFLCEVCLVENETTLDDFIQITFTVSPQIRDIKYHHPDRLSAEELYLNYHLIEGVEVPPGAPGFKDMLRQATQVMEFLEPGQTRSYPLDLPPGFLLARNVDVGAGAVYTIEDKPEGDPVHMDTLHFTEDSVTSKSGFQPGRYEAHEVRFDFNVMGRLNSGDLTLTVENGRARRSPLWLLHYPPLEPAPLHFAPYLSGKDLLSTQTFRDLFRVETIETEEGIAIRDITLLFTDLKSSTDLYDRIGDAQAYFLVRQHFEALRESINAHSGAVVKTIGDAVMASFSQPVGAVRAALESLERVNAFNRSISEELILKIGIHRGHCIAVTSNDRIDYFGQTVNIAARVQGLAGAGEICLSDEVAEAPGVREAIKDRALVPEKARVKGVGRELTVYKVTAG